LQSKKIKLIHPSKNNHKSNINSNLSSKHNSGTKPTFEFHNETLRENNKVLVVSELLSQLKNFVADLISKIDTLQTSNTKLGKSC